ncbi:NosD domain-containing protein [Longimicrobium sp.]|uniref:NosD domain-containing protein n=1 Tax=Longimicrobium sp. TaxID=2029185 RepID=UPI003B3B04F9
MRSHTLAPTLVLTVLLAAACADQPPAPTAPADGPSLANAAKCPASPTFVVDTDPELRAALAAAQDGDVVAVSGNIEVDSAVVIDNEGVTLTCAEPGAGISFDYGYENILIELRADRITVSGLKLDAEYGYAAFNSLPDEDDGYQDIRITGNEVYCGYYFCLYAVGIQGTVITDNHWIGEDTRYGVHIQGIPGSGSPVPTGGYTEASADGTFISRNVIETDGGYESIYGAIRVREGRDVTITHNEVLGDWSHGVVLTNVYDSRVEHNRIDGTLLNGIEFAERAANRVSISGVSIKANRISNAGGVGIAIRGACYNTFQGNNLQNTSVGAVFEPNTGANIYRGNNEVVTDLGAFDCDEDGDIDPNDISGAQ